MTLSNSKEAMQWANRMSKRQLGIVPFNQLHDYVYKSPSHTALCNFTLAIADKFDTEIRVGATDLPSYFNDTFMDNGKPWWNDITNLFKTAIEIENVGTLHFYIHQHEIVLDKIEVVEQNKGLGTLLLNTVLDVVDHYGIKLHTYPTAIQKVESDEEAKQKTIKLRKWFKDFEFKSNMLSARMTYNSK